MNRRIFQPVPGLRLFWLGYAGSQIGTAAWKISLPWTVFANSRSVYALGLSLLVTLVPELFFAATAGVIADRRRRLPTLMSVDAMRAAVYLGGALATVLVTGRTALSAVLLLTALLDSLLNLVYTSSRAALLNELAAEAVIPLRTLLGNDRAVRNTADIAGMAIGGALIAHAPIGLVMTGNGSSFLIGLLGLTSVRRLMVRPRLETGRETRQPKGFAGAALKSARDNIILRDALVRQLAANLPIPVILLGLPLLLHARHESAGFLGLITAAFSAGALVVSFGIGNLRRSAAGDAPRRAWSVLVGASAVLALTLTLPAPWMPLPFAVLGAAFTWVLLDANLQWQSRLDSGQIGRFTSLASLTARLAAVSATIGVTAVCGLVSATLALPLLVSAIGALAGGLALFAPSLQGRVHGTDGT